MPWSAERGHFVVDPVDDVYAFFLTVGSPALAAYSLQITQLNARWLFRLFSGVNYRNSNAIPTAISALQHIPNRLSSNPILLPSLIVLPQNEEYWGILLKSARKIRRWSVSLVVNFVWIIVSAILTIIGTFYAPVPGEIGYGTVTSLAYLLPLMIGWLYVGSEPESGHLKDSLKEANSVARVATDKRDEPVFAKDLKGQPNRPIEAVERHRVDLARKDESRTNPIFNYSRAFFWAQNAEVIYRLVRNAAEREERGVSVHCPSTMDGAGARATKDRNWTANEVIRHCASGDTPFERFFKAPLPILLSPLGFPNGSTTIGLLPSFVGHKGIQEPSLWPAGTWERVTLAASLALGLQWGTTGAGIFIYYRMHPVGLGCRTTSLLIYGILGTVSFLFLLASSILAHLSRPRPGPGHRYSRFRVSQEFGAILCRWLGKIVATISGLGILVISLVQPLGIFDNCWCSTMTFDRPSRPVAFMMGNFITQWGVLPDWIGGLAMAFGAATLFGFFIYLGTPRGR